jgi:carboxyl-terminal processing protease
MDEHDPQAAVRRTRENGRSVGRATARGLVAAGLLLVTPAAPASAAGAPCPTPAPAPASSVGMPASDRTELFEAVWAAIDQRYVDPAHNGVDWAAVRTEFAPRIAAATTEGEVDSLLSEMVSRLGDGQAEYLPRPVEDADEGLAGIGILYDREPTDDRTGMRILYVMPDSPAERAGLHDRDRIVAVDADRCPRRSIIGGEAGTSLDLLVDSPGGGCHLVTAIREPIHRSVMPEVRLVPRYGGGQVGYLRMPNLDEPDAGDAVVTALAGLLAGGPLDGIVLDLRSAGGTNDDAIETIAGQFRSGTVARLRGRDDTTDWDVPAGRLLSQLEHTALTVLIDEHTGGAAEILAGILRDGDHVTTVGHATASETLRAEGIALPGGRSLSLVTHVDVLPDGSPLTPVAVDVPVAGEWLDQPESADSGIGRALDSFGGYGPGADLIPLATPAPPPGCDEVTTAFAW